MRDEEIISLIHKYRSGTLTEAEELAFFSWYAEVEADSFHRILQQAGEVSYEPASPAFHWMSMSSLSTSSRVAPPIRVGTPGPVTWSHAPGMRAASARMSPADHFAAAFFLVFFGGVSE